MESPRPQDPEAPPRTLGGNALIPLGGLVTALVLATAVWLAWQRTRETAPSLRDAPPPEASGDPRLR